jgi:ArsR family transcriptional regulator
LITAISVIENLEAKMFLETDLFELHARICSSLANSRRLMILSSLRTGEKSVSELVEDVGAPQATISRHLALMRAQGVVSDRRDGQNVYYQITNPKIISAFDLMHEVTLEYLEDQASLRRFALGGEQVGL